MSAPELRQAAEAGASPLDGRLGGRRNLARETRANAVYEEVRRWKKDRLYERAGVWPKAGYSRQELIAMIIQKEES